MLRRNMKKSLDIQLALEDLLADLRFARKHGELGRLALLAYCDVKGWARRAGKTDVAEKALQMFSESPCLSKSQFLEGIDSLIETMELHEHGWHRTNNRLTLINTSSHSASLEPTCHPRSG
jgi:hypothetical protein